MKNILDAVRTNDLEQTRKLLRGGIFREPVRIQALEGNTVYESPLHMAAGLGNVQMCTLLLEHGANVNLQSKLGISATTYSPLAQAIGGDHVDTVLCLLDKGADPHIVKKDADLDLAWPALHCAASRGAVKTLRALISRGSDVNGLGGHGDGAIHIAAMFVNAEILQALLDMNADVSLRTSDGSRTTALHILAFSLHVEEGVMRTETSRQKRTQTNSISSLKSLLEAGADPNAQDAKGFTPLHRLLSSINYFLYRGFETAIDRFVAPFARSIIDHGADPGLQNADGKVPIELLSGACSNERLVKKIRKSLTGHSVKGSGGPPGPDDAATKDQPMRGDACSHCGEPYGEMASLDFQRGGYSCSQCGRRVCDRCCYRKAKSVGRMTMLCPHCGSDAVTAFRA